MKINIDGLSNKDFMDIVGETVLTPVTLPALIELDKEIHSSVDVSPVPFWATKIQDIIENKYVTYSERDIEEELFLGLKVISYTNGLAMVSVGRVGDAESLITVSFKIDEHDQIGDFRGVRTKAGVRNQSEAV